MKSAQKNTERKLFYKMYQVNDTFQLCDGYVGIVLKSSIKGLELYIDDEDCFDCRKVLKTSSGNDFRYDHNFEKIELDLFELEQKAITAKRATQLPLECMCQIENYYYNPVYMLRAIKILGTKDVDVYIDKSGNHNEAYLWSELGQGLITGIKMQKNK